MIDETCQESKPFPQSALDIGGVRTLSLQQYAIPRAIYAGELMSSHHQITRSAIKRLAGMGLLFWYGSQHPGTKRKKPVNVDVLVKKWHPVIVGLAVAHDKDDADRHESQLDDLLSPLLTAPVKQLREFAKKLLASLKADKTVPYLVWRGYEVWVDKVIMQAPDEDVVALKTQAATEVMKLVEEDVKDQLPEAIVRALQWRSAERLAEVKTVVEREKAAGRKTRLVGRESCLFIESGPEVDNPAVCIQL